MTNIIILVRQISVLHYVILAINLLLLFGLGVVTESVSETNQKKLEDRTIELSVLDYLFPHKALDHAWESYPLLSTPYPVTKYMIASNHDNDSNKVHYEEFIHPIQTIHSSNITTTTNNGNDQTINLHKRIHFFQKLMDISHINDLLSPRSGIPAQFGVNSDFQMVKRTVRPDGSEWLGVFNKPNLTPEDALHAFQFGNFSLVVNKMQQKWGPIAQLARQLALEIIPRHVSCNLYLTPGAKSESPRPTNKLYQKPIQKKTGFETHFDWMDVIVLQISGEKVWSVATSPLVYLSTQDLKRKPSLKELTQYTVEGGTYSEFLLRPGDSLYIPRGFLHNASTVSENTMFVSRDESNNYDVGTSSSYLDNEHYERLSNEPSLHLTFGIEHDSGTIFGDLFSFAFSLFAHDESEKQKLYNLNDLVIEKHQCTKRPNPDSENQDVSWMLLFSYVMKEITRRHCPNSFRLNSSLDKSFLQEKNAISCLLRKSIPLHPAWKQLFVAQLDHSETDCTLVHDNDSNTKNHDNNNSCLDQNIQTFLMATIIPLYRTSLSLSKTLGFISKQINDPENPLTFSDVPICKSALTPQVKDIFGTIVNDFMDFVESRLDSILQAFQENIKEKQRVSWKGDDELLALIGHSTNSF